MFFHHRRRRKAKQPKPAKPLKLHKLKPLRQARRGGTPKPQPRCGTPRRGQPHPAPRRQPKPRPRHLRHLAARAGRPVRRGRTLGVRAYAVLLTNFGQNVLVPVRGRAYRIGSRRQRGIRRYGQLFEPPSRKAYPVVRAERRFGVPRRPARPRRRRF